MIGLIDRRRLMKLAEAYGVQPVYVDALGKRRRSPPEAVAAVLRALGASVETASDADDALRLRTRERWSRVLEPVTVAWAGRPAAASVRLAEPAPDAVLLEVTTEDSRAYTHASPLTTLRVIEKVEVDGVTYRQCAAPLPAGLPPGFHLLALTLEGRRHEALLICAPYRFFDVASGGKQWAAFTPLYALSSRAHPEAGTFEDLAHLIAWVRGLGGLGVATLPLLAAFLRTPLEPSPYAPVSRLFWNEFYVDAAAAPEAAGDALAAHPLPPPDSRLVDYATTAAIRRANLERLAERFFADPTNDGRRRAFKTFVAEHPLVESYARFQATVERQGAGWPAWPAALQQSELVAADHDDGAYRYHLYAQWRAHEQIGAAGRAARQSGEGLYLDVPLGVHGGGFDTWRYRALFAHGISAGAPPDPFFTKGQVWGFPPLVPEAVRADRYVYVRAYLEHHLAHAAVLRLDHVMALHRLFWVPAGFDATDGVYVHSPAEEWYGLLSLLSHRHRARIVGENLGTVPAAINDALAAHGLQRMFVLQYEINPEATPPVRQAPADTVAGLNTHDMPPFAAFWNEADIADRIDLGLLDKAQASAERVARDAKRDALRAWAGVPASADLRTVLVALLERLAASPARMLIVNLEDLWFEELAQNTPGTVAERPNWRRRLRLDLESLVTDPSVREALEAVARKRREGEAP